jgi:hypothetical protein
LCAGLRTAHDDISDDRFGHLIQTREHWARAFARAGQKVPPPKSPNYQHFLKVSRMSHRGSSRFREGSPQRTPI